jgi:carbonic anhydrase
MPERTWGELLNNDKTCSAYEEFKKSIDGADGTNNLVPKNIVTYSENNENNPMTCIQRCGLTFNYGTSSCKISKTSYYISVEYDATNPAKYNNISFTPVKINIFRPSLHTYDGYQTDAEMIIEHTTDDAAGGISGLLLCIPLVSSSLSVRNTASQIIETIINNIPTGSDESATPSVTDFTLNTIVPKAPYYNYRGFKPYDKCDGNKIYQYVVFNPLNQGAIAIDFQSLRALRNALSASFILANDTTPEDISYNSRGTSLNNSTVPGEVSAYTGPGDGDDQIYIQCQPTGESNDEKIFKEPKVPFAIDMNSKNDNLNNILFTIIGIVAIFIAYMVFKYLTAFVSSYKVNTNLKIETG